VRLQTEFDMTLPRVSGDPVQLTQVVLNLIINGCEAMSHQPERDRRLSLHVAHADADHVHVLVSDSGVGLPTNSESRVFDPFFTTKEKGLGLGLTISQSIVTAHHGQLWAENNPDRGATFHLLLPADALDHGRAGRGLRQSGTPLTA
jgi:two-component system, LuxR family, sensor kinase FixL